MKQMEILILTGIERDLLKGKPKPRGIVMETRKERPKAKHLGFRSEIQTGLLRQTEIGLGRPMVKRTRLGFEMVRHSEKPMDLLKEIR